MLFNSLDFFIFFPIVVALYFAIKPKYRWVLLLASSYYFYSRWKPEYLILIAFSTWIDYYCGIKMGDTLEKSVRKKYLYISLFSNLTLLGVFKYFNFFYASVYSIFTDVTYTEVSPLLKILLPVGISFYTFQTLSYSIDVYYGRIKPERHLGIFALYVTFFPQLVAGPIERAKRLLPQFRIDHSFDYERIRNGLLLMMLGMFKKVVIADRVADYVNNVFNNPEIYKGLQIWIANLFFYVQLYCDFSGYSDIAIGAAAVMGYKLMLNFRQPYFAQDVQDFWSRWHISLTTWFRDYLFAELRGKNRTKARLYLNILIVFTITGFWHGANWTFIYFGVYHGILIILTMILRPYVVNFKTAIGLYKWPVFNQILNIVLTINLIASTTWVFRSNSISDSLILLKNTFLSWEGSLNLFTYPADMSISLVFITLLILVEVAQEKKKLGIILIKLPVLIKWTLLILALMAFVFFAKFNAQDFIYFQF
jgi:alginate O-acetyltransferase complex protein AlgI